MGIYVRLTDLEAKFRSRTGAPPTIVNDLESKTEEDRERVNETLLTITGDVFDNIPQCHCGKRKGKHRLGLICTNCNTPVEQPVEEYLDSLVWIRTPKDIISLINPHIWLMLRDKFSIKSGTHRFECLCYMTDNAYTFEGRVTPAIESFKRIIQVEKIKRSFNFFVDNFDSLIDFLFNLDLFKKTKSEPEHPLYTLIKQERDKIFTNYIPVPNKSLLIVEKASYGHYYLDAPLKAMIDALRLVTGIDVETISPPSQRVKENRMSRMLTLITDYHKEILKLHSKKVGIFRKQVYGTRCDYTFRTVVTSLRGQHDYDEIHVPWGVAMNVLYNHLASKLMHRGHTPNQIFRFLNKYKSTYSETIDQLFHELISEAGEKGIPLLVNRNPSLGKGSIQRVYLTKVKKPSVDLTCSLSILITANMNCDFDGDQLNFLMLLDKDFEQAARLLAPEANIFDLHSKDASSCTALPKPVVTGIANYLEGEDTPDEEVFQRMLTLTGD